MGDCQVLVADSIDAFRAAAIDALAKATPSELSLEELEREQAMLGARLERFGALSEPMDIWRALGIKEPAQLPMLDSEQFVQQVATARAGAL
jgi:malonate decarboxylase beta subunit